MKIPVIKKLAEGHTLEELQAAEEALYNEQAPSIEVKGSQVNPLLHSIINSVGLTI